MRNVRIKSLSAVQPTRRTDEPTVSIIVPAKNEALNLRQVLPALPDVYEVILVDGNSRDDTIAVALEVMPGIRVVRQTRRGKGNALACGFAAATGDILVMFDADGSADPAEIALFVGRLVEGADFAKGSRFAPGGGSEDITRVRQWGNTGLQLIANVAFRTPFSDLCYGYNAFWRDLLPLLDLPDVHADAPTESMLWGDGFEIEAVINCRMAAGRVAIVEVPSVERKRLFGDSNLNAVSDGLRVLRTIIAERRRARRSRLSASASSLSSRQWESPIEDLDVTCREQNDLAETA